DSWASPYRLAVKRKIGPGQGAVPADIGAKHVFQLRRAIALDRFPQGTFGLPLPAVRHDARHSQRIDGNIESQGQPLWAELPQPRLNEFNLRHGGAADHSTFDSHSQHLLERVGAAQS